MEENRKFLDAYFKRWSTKDEVPFGRSKKPTQQNNNPNQSNLMNSSPSLTTGDLVQHEHNYLDQIKLTKKIRRSMDSSSLVSPNDSMQYKLIIDPVEKELLEKVQNEINKRTVRDVENSENISADTADNVRGKQRENILVTNQSNASEKITMSTTKSDEKALLTGIEREINQNICNGGPNSEDITTNTMKELTTRQNMIVTDHITKFKEETRGTKRRLNDLEILDSTQKIFVETKCNEKMTQKDSSEMKGTSKSPTSRGLEVMYCDISKPLTHKAYGSNVLKEKKLDHISKQANAIPNVYTLQVKTIHEEGDKVKARSSLKGGKGWYNGTVKSRRSSEPVDKRYGSVHYYSIQFQDGQTDSNVHEVNVIKVQDFKITDKEMETFCVVRKRDKKSEDKYARIRGWYCLSSGEYFSSVSDALKKAQAIKD